LTSFSLCACSTCLAVQKAKQVEQAHKEKLVKPADEILDEKPKK